MSNLPHKSHKILDCSSNVSSTLVECSCSSSHSTPTILHFRNIEDDTPDPCHRSMKVTADEIIPLPRSTPSTKALTQENLNACQQEMDDRKDDKHNDNAALGAERSGQEAHLKLIDAALSLGIPLYECFMDELINWPKGTTPLERFMLENTAEPSGTITD